MTWLDNLERYHAGLAIVSLAWGAVVAILLWTLPSPARAAGGRLSFCVVAALCLTTVGVVPLTLGVGAAVFAMGAASVAKEADTPIVPWLTLISLVGVWAAVPDTEAPLIVAAVVAVPVVTGRVGSVRVGDRLASLAAVVVVAWVGAGGHPQLIGGLGCVGLLVFSWREATSTRQSWVIVVMHLALVGLSSRVLTRWSWGPAAVGLVALLAGSGLAQRYLSPTSRGRTTRQGVP